MASILTLDEISNVKELKFASSAACVFQVHCNNYYLLHCSIISFKLLSV